jgi:glycosyltransferase involved in cell wall biosynthesis
LTRAIARQAGSVAIVTPTESRYDQIVVPEGVTIHGPEADLEAAVARAEVVHMHGLWQAHTRRGARAARRARVPYLIAAHGMAEPWALRQKALKKRVYTMLVEGKNLQNADCLHALTRPEITHLRALAPRSPVCLVPNGVDLEPFDNLPPREDLEREHPELTGKFLLLFLSRLHAKKGLDLLATAFARIAVDFPTLHLLIAGKDDGAREPFDTAIRASGLDRRVTHLGHVSGESARRAWGAADAFILPSYSEGFSMAILEALAARLPSIITTACHFPELAAADGAITVAPNAPEVETAIRQLLERFPAERAAMAARGRALVERRYTWDRQAAALTEVYRWIRNGGPRPDSVFLAGESA